MGLFESAVPVTQRVARYLAERSVLQARQAALLRELGAPKSSSCPTAHVYHRRSAIGDGQTTAPATAISDLITLTRSETKDPRRPIRSYVTRSPVGPEADAKAIANWLLRRRSALRFSNEEMPAATLFQCLELACGISDRSTAPALRTHPSAGALYPIRTYVWPARVSGVEAGLYWYQPNECRISLVDPRLPQPDQLAAAIPAYSTDAPPAAVLILAADLNRIQKKYAERGYRFALLECGHIAQSVLLVSTALGVATLPVGGFWDSRLNDLVGIDGLDNVSLYVILLGQPEECAS